MNFNNTPINWNQIHEVISAAERIMLTTHENPDGDGLGSESGLYHHLTEIGKDVRIINYSALPEEYEFLNQGMIFEQYEPSEHDEWLQAVQLILVFDVGDFKRLRTLADVITKYNLVTMNIDHHPHPDENYFNHNIVNLKAAATGCMVYDYFQVVREVPLSKDICDGLYTAVMTDTGCFRYSNTDNKCHLIAIESLSKGVKTHEIYQQIYENSSQARIQLLGELLSNLHYELDNTFAWFDVTQDMISRAHAAKSDVDGFSDMVRTIKGVEVALMIMENDTDTCRVNFRSKGKFSVNDIAKSLGGGGHPFAAGAIVAGSLDRVRHLAVTNTIDSLEKKMKGGV